LTLFNLEDLGDTAPFSLNKEQKTALLSGALSQLTKHHYDRCAPYKRILDAKGFNPDLEHEIEELPFLPVRLFKNHELLSVEKSEVIKTMTSSGTSSQSVSRIYLDKVTASNQTRVLTKIVSDFTGTKRRPMLVIDTKSVLKDRNMFSARGAGILGFSMMGRDVTYALDENMKLDFNAVDAFCDKYREEPIFLFGFTYMIWEHFYKELAQSGRRLPLDGGLLIHGGGWKKLISQAVDNEKFKELIREVAGIKRVHSYYGMVEQTGSIFMECEQGFLHSSIFSDVIIRKNDFSVSEEKQPGMVQLVSLLPSSYPGHVLLSEDMGEILGEDDCPCGRFGKYFKIHGRIPQAEARGCGDTYVTPG